MSSLSVQIKDLKCPVCLAIPLVNVYLCKNGHIICQSCCEQRTVCPQCRCDLKVDGVFIRNLVFEENLSKSTDIPCPFSELGCDFKGLQIEVNNHKFKFNYKGHSGSLFQQLRFDCDFSSYNISKEEKMNHFVENHQAVICTNPVKTVVQNWEQAGKLLIVRLEDGCIVMVLERKDDSFYKWKCVLLENPHDANYEATFGVGWNNNNELDPLKWTIPVVPLNWITGSMGSLGIQEEDLRKLCDLNGALGFEVSVKRI